MTQTQDFRYDLKTLQWDYVRAVGGAFLCFAPLVLIEVVPHELGDEEEEEGDLDREDDPVEEHHPDEALVDPDHSEQYRRGRSDMEHLPTTTDHLFDITKPTRLVS